MCIRDRGRSFLKKLDLDYVVLFFLLFLPVVEIMEQSLISKVIKQVVLAYVICFCIYLLYLLNRYFLIPSLLKKKGIIYFGAGITAISLIGTPIFLQIMNWLQAIFDVKYFLVEDIFSGLMPVINTLIVSVSYTHLTLPTICSV